MILYHGSYLEVPNPDLKHSRSNVDFGAGFYTTPLREQAEKWCTKFKCRGRNGVISSYSFDKNKDGLIKTLAGYEDSILQADEKEKMARLFLVDIVQKVLRETCGLLGIQCRNLADLVEWLSICCLWIRNSIISHTYMCTMVIMRLRLE